MLLAAIKKMFRIALDWACISIFLGAFLLRDHVQNERGVFHEITRLPNAKLFISTMTAACLLWAFVTGFYLFIRINSMHKK